MGIFSRMKDIMASNINAILDKAEDPSKMIEQMLRQAREDLAEVKQETATVMANEKDAYRKLQETTEEMDKYTKAAEKAVKSGNDADALKLLESKDRVSQKLQGIKENYDAAHKDAENMRTMYNKLSNDIESLEYRKDTIRSKAATAKAREHANKVTAGKSNTSSLEAFDRMEAKVNKMLDTANAAAELDRADSEDEDLLSKYGGATSSTAEDELRAMKERLGMS